ncbi:MAG TPA: carboxypeptidase-like regulatory domain-containing protein [Candidatus Dormibacteraeota bacterium]|nr:carboxypeptidase-like regulatory domain-containing protein [Candidatus Dormibacteraeota bacterium]
MKAILRGIAFATLALLVVACNENAFPPGAQFGSVQGTVLDAATNQPIAGAQVTVDTVLTTTTDAAGHFTFERVPTGAFDYTVAATGFVALSSTGSAQPGKTSAVMVTLTATP